MSEEKKAAVDTETILITLDQIGQTIDIMTNVAGRLRGYITEQIHELENDQPALEPLETLDTLEQDLKPGLRSASHTLH